jgi:hypothetical protein
MAENNRLRAEKTTKPIAILNIVSIDTNTHDITGKYWYSVQPEDCVICDSIALSSSLFYNIRYDRWYIYDHLIK